MSLKTVQRSILCLAVLALSALPALAAEPAVPACDASAFLVESLTQAPVTPITAPAPSLELLPAVQPAAPFRGYCRCTCSLIKNCNTSADCGGSLCLGGPTCC